jgi:hypothetical protein
MSRQAIHIALTNPCDQRWEDMTPNGNGRFCTHCQTTVIDFTTWTDHQLYEYFASHKGRTCGQFLRTQLNRPIQIPYQPNSRLYRMTIAMGLTLLFTQTPQLYAQATPMQTTQPQASTKSGDTATKHTTKDPLVKTNNFPDSIHNDNGLIGDVATIIYNIDDTAALTVDPKSKKKKTTKRAHSPSKQQ